MAEIVYDDSRLQAFFASLSVKERAKLFRGALFGAADMVKKDASAKLHQKLDAPKAIDKHIRTAVWKKKIGFRVTVGPKSKGKGRAKVAKKKTNRREYLPMILVWAEMGTEDRFAGVRNRRAKGRYLAEAKDRLRSGYRTGYRGRMPAGRFMAETKTAVNGKVTQYLRTSIQNKITKLAQKYGI